MKIENEIFKKSKLNKSSLIKYGFKKVNNSYIFEKYIMDDTFKIIINIDNKDLLSAKIYDIDMEEEYRNHLVETNNGSFVNKVRNEYITLLNDIKDKCYTTRDFIFDQTNRVEKYILDKYNDKPEFLWPKYPGYGVFRNKRTKKWYAIITNIDKSKITSGTGEVEVINFKIDAKKVPLLIKQDNIYEAYHMNKKSWITIILDDSLKDEEIFKYLDMSYEIIDKK